MAPGEEYSAVGGAGKLKLKGSKIKDGRVEKKKKKKKEHAEPSREASAVTESQHEGEAAAAAEQEDDVPIVEKTEAEKKHEEMRRKRVCLFLFLLFIAFWFFFFALLCYMSCIREKFDLLPGDCNVSTCRCLLLSSGEDVSFFHIQLSFPQSKAISITNIPRY